MSALADLPEECLKTQKERERDYLAEEMGVALDGFLRSPDGRLALALLAKKKCHLVFKKIGHAEYQLRWDERTFCRTDLLNVGGGGLTWGGNPDFRTVVDRAYDQTTEFVAHASLVNEFSSVAGLMAFIESELDRISELK